MNFEYNWCTVISSTFVILLLSNGCLPYINSNGVHFVAVWTVVLILNMVVGSASSQFSS